MAAEGFWTSGGTFDSAEMRKFNAALVDAAPPGGVIWGMGTRLVSAQVVIDGGACAIADGAGGAYIIKQNTATTPIVPPTSPGTYIIYVTEQDPGVGATAGEPTYAIGSSLPALSIPLGNIVIAVGGGQSLTTGSRRTAKVLGVSDGGNAALLNSHQESALSVNQAVAATKLGTGGTAKVESQLNVATASSATGAANAERVGNDSTYMRFHWSGQPGTPQWLWGGSTPGDAYLYAPSGMVIGYAANAEQANKAYNADYATSAGTVANAPKAVGFAAADAVAQSATGWQSNGAYTYFHETPLRIPNLLIAAGAADVRWGSSNGAFVRASSSRRYKKDIVDLPVSVAALRALRPVEFAYDNSVDGVQDDFGRQGGFIAEEVDEHFPEAVHRNDKGEVENVHDRSLLAGAYKLIGDLYERIEALEARLAE